MSQVLTTSRNVCHRSVDHCMEGAYCVLLDFCSQLTFHLFAFCSLYREISHCEVMTHVIVSLSFFTAVDGDRLVMKGAKLTSREMLTAFQSRCLAKDPQAKAAAKKWWSACWTYLYWNCIYLCTFFDVYSKHVSLNEWVLLWIDLWATYSKLIVKWACMILSHFSLPLESCYFYHVKVI